MRGWIFMIVVGFASSHRVFMIVCWMLIPISIFLGYVMGIYIQAL